MLEFFTANVGSSLLVLFFLGLLSSGIAFYAEVFNIYERVRFALDKRQRHKITWKTIVWMPVRLYVIIMIPQVFYIFFTQIVSFG